jgi:hypothetical protein
MHEYLKTSIKIIKKLVILLNLIFNLTLKLFFNLYKLITLNLVFINLFYFKIYFN